jgi:hypothetical protein
MAPACQRENIFKQPPMAIRIPPMINKKLPQPQLGYIPYWPVG